MAFWRRIGRGLLESSSRPEGPYLVIPGTSGIVSRGVRGAEVRDRVSYQEELGARKFGIGLVRVWVWDAAAVGWRASRGCGIGILGVGGGGIWGMTWGRFAIFTGMGRCSAGRDAGCTMGVFLLGVLSVSELWGCDPAVPVAWPAPLSPGPAL